MLLRSFAAQIAEVYEQAAENIPLAILDELMSSWECRNVRRERRRP